MRNSVFIFPIHAFRVWPFRNLPVRLFSWKSRQNRDPDQRRIKQEALAKRYTIRRIDPLEGIESCADPHAVFLDAKGSIDKIVTDFENKLRMFSSGHGSLSMDVIQDVQIGSMLLKNIALLSQPNPRTVVVVVKDRGSIDLVLKFIKRANTNWIATVIDRERIEISVREGTLRSEKEAQRLLDAAEKALKKAELLLYQRIRKHGGISDSVSAAIREEFLLANARLKKR